MGQELACMLLHQEHWDPGAVIIRQGHEEDDEESRRIYLIEEGKCRIDILGARNTHGHGGTDDSSQLLGIAQHFGMYHMFYGCPSGCTVTAILPTTTLSISYGEL